MQLQARVPGSAGPVITVVELMMMTITRKESSGTVVHLSDSGKATRWVDDTGCLGQLDRVELEANVSIPNVCFQVQQNGLESGLESNSEPEYYKPVHLVHVYRGKEVCSPVSSHVS